MATSVYLRQGRANPSDVTLQDPTQNQAKAYALEALPASFELTGVQAGLEVAYVLSADAASFSVVGFDGDLVKTNAYELNAEPGSFSISGDATLEYSGEEQPRGQVPAGSNKKKKRRKLVIGDAVVWARDEDIPALLQSILERPSVPDPVVKAAKRPKKSETKIERVAHVQGPVIASEARFMALLKQFEDSNQADLVASLQLARERMIEIDDEELFLLL